MKRLCPNFQRSKWTASVGFPVALAAIFLSLAASVVHAGTARVQTPHPPPWIPFELNALSLLQSGIGQESSNPQGALETLKHARQESTAAIANGGGANWAVLHNDYVIGQELMMAQRAAAKAPEINKPAQNQNQTSVGNNRAVLVSGARHVPAASPAKLRKE